MGAGEAAKKVAAAPVKAISKIPGGFINKVIALLFIALVIVGAFMYFGVSAGAKDVQFVDLQVKVGSVALSPAPSPELPLFSHSIESVSGFNEVVVYGKVKVNRDIEKDDVFVGLQFTLSECRRCPTCPALTRYGESHTFPNPNSYILIVDLAGRKAGDVIPFEYRVKRETFVRFLQSVTRASLNDVGQVEHWVGKAYLAIVQVPENMKIDKNTRYMYGEPVVVVPPLKAKRVKVFEWDFNAKHYKFHSIFVSEDGIDWPVGHSVVEMPTQSAEISLKVSNSAAVLTLSFIVLSMALLSLGVVKWADVSLWVKLLLFALIVALILLIPRLFGAM